jgi:WhiB family redox-sensing transcriptional regulator
VQGAQAVDPLVLTDHGGGDPGCGVTALADTSTSWLELAACRGKPLSWWYSDSAYTQGVARLVCRSCPVRGECLAEALALEVNGERYGMRGGLSADERRGLHVRLRRQQCE